MFSINGFESLTMLSFVALNIQLIPSHYIMYELDKLQKGTNQR